MHVKIQHGKCPICGHFGSDCTGSPEFSDATIHVLDLALSAAESKLQKLLATLTPEEIRDAFERHVSTHLQEELSGAMKYRNNVRAFRRAVNEGKDSAF